MTLYYRIRSLVRWLFRRDEIERALDADLEDYIERSAAEKIRAGMSEKEARRAARIELGGVEQTKDRVRETLALGPIEKLVSDLSYAFRTLSRQKTFTTVTVLTLALGMGVNVAILSLTEQVLLRPLPVPEPDRLVSLTSPGPVMVGMASSPYPSARPSLSGGPDTVFSYPMFRDLERAQTPFTGLAAHTFFQYSDKARLATGVFVSGSYFSVLGLQPALGRLLGPQDDAVDGEAESIVLSHAYWQSEFGGDPAVVGRTLLVKNVPLTIVGVAPPGFNGMAVSARPSVFVPITILFPDEKLHPFVQPVLVPNHDARNNSWVHLLGRLKQAVTREQAAAAMNPLYRAILSEVEAPMLAAAYEPQREAFRTRTLVLEPGARGQTRSEILSPARNSLELLLAVSGAVLLLCCANVAGLLQLRATARSGELAVRASLGATRMRLASLLLAEPLALAVPAALLSLPIAWLALRGARIVPGIPAAAPDATLSGAAALVAISVALVTALIVGLLPVRDLTRTKPGSALQTYGARHTTTKKVARFRTALATAQVALSMALLAVMGIFTQSLANIARLDPGVNIDSVIMFQVPPPNGLSTHGDDIPRLTEALETMPGVSGVTWSMRPLLSPDASGGRFPQLTLEGSDAEAVRTSADIVSPNFFQTFGVELLAGREFMGTERLEHVIVNRRLTEHFGLSPAEIVGRNVRLPAAPGSRPLPVQIVGVVEDMTYGKVTNIEPQMFNVGAAEAGLSYGGATTFYVRATRPPDDLLNAVRETIARLDTTMAITNLRTMEQQIRENIAPERFVAGASTAFAVLATVLAGLGLYGVLAYSVAQRSREIGLRVALGAPLTRIRGMVLRQVTRMAVIGVVFGVVAAWFVGRAARSLLFGVEAADPLAIVAAAAVVAAVTLGAAYLPARRASRVDPMSVLRDE